MPAPVLALTAMPVVSLPVLPAAAGGPFAWSLALSAAVVVLTMLPLGAARSQAEFTASDLSAPRAMFERLPAWGKRATWAHLNSFEAFTLHAPACLLCLVAAPAVLAAAPWIAVAAWLHPLLRAGHLGAYLANLPPLRSLCWLGGLFCSGLLYAEGLRAVLRS